MEREERTLNYRELERLGEKILAAARQELYLSMRYLYLALERMPVQADRRVHWLGTDGRQIYFHPMFLAEQFRQDGVKVNRAYLHSVLHGMFAHMYRQGERERELWNLAADIAVGGILDSLDNRAVRAVVGERREACYRWLSERTGVLSAERIYELLREEFSEQAAFGSEPVMQGAFGGRLAGQTFDELSEAFLVDDHSFWEIGEDENPNPREQEQKQREQELWRETREKVQTELETYARTAGMEKSRLYQAVAFENRERTSYREFLRKFAAIREIQKIDMDSFDYGYYQYGMQMYGNMPLIEELEYREENSLREFAVVLDTSGSCSRELIVRFLQETVNILLETESLGTGLCCHILQCDNQIQTETAVRNTEELQRYVDEFVITGRGGTDFRPAFEYVQERKSCGEWKSLQGLLYFTDGYGIYPKGRPDYQTAFLFPELSGTEGKPPWKTEGFPAWAMYLELTGEN